MQPRRNSSASSVLNTGKFQAEAVSKYWHTLGIDYPTDLKADTLNDELVPIRPYRSDSGTWTLHEPIGATTCLEPPQDAS